MPGSFIARAHGTNTTSQTTVVTSTSLTTLAGDSLLALVTYDGGDDTPNLGTDFGTWVEDTSLQRLSQSPRFHVYRIDSASAGTFSVTSTFGSARADAGIVVIQARGCAAYQGGVFPAYSAPGSGTGVITSGNYNVLNQPNYLIGFAWDMDKTGTAPPVTSGNGFTSRATCWLFGAGTDNARVVDNRATSNGNIAVTFDSGFGSHSYTCLLLAFTEAAAGGTVNTATLTDTLSSIDGVIQSATRGNVSSDSIAIVDSFFLWWYRTRVLQSSVTVTEGSTEVYTTTNMQAIDELTIVDELVSWLRRQRLLDDAIAVTDELIASTIGYLIFISVLTSQLTITDEALPYRYFSRLLESGLLTVDQAMRSMFVARTLLDTVEITDQNLTALQRFILLTDTLSIDDSLSSALVTPGGPVTTNPVILIGFDQPRIEVGGYGL